MLIDASYFVGEINIPNTGTPAVAERLTFFIQKYEAELLRHLLGYEFAAEVFADLTLWAELIDGEEYTDGWNKMHHWEGLRNSTTKQSIIANYVYYWWMRDQSTQTTGIGEVNTNAEAGVKVSPADKMCRAWNAVAETAIKLNHYLSNNREAYALWDMQLSFTNQYLFRPINSFGI